MSAPPQTHVVTCFVRHRGDVLLLRRSPEVGSYPGRWGGVAGHVEDDGPDAAARRELAEETGLLDDVTLVRRGTPFPVDDADLGRRWIVHPYLFDCPRRDVRLNWESEEADWVSPTEILRRDTVPELWTSYVRVAPTVQAVHDDAVHGSASISVRALEVLRDRAGLLSHAGIEPDAARAALRGAAGDLLAARPSMAALANRIHRVMHTCRDELAPASVAHEAHAAIGRAIDADAAASRRAAALVAGTRVLTLSRSGTVAEALLAADPPPSVVVAESRPACEGTGAAERLARAGLDVTLVPDAAAADALEHFAVERILTGADAVLPDGSVVNKTGTRAVALAARAAGIPVYAVAARDKVAVEDTPSLEQGPAEALYDGDAPLHVYSPTFEVTPADLFTGLVMEDAHRRPGAVRGVAEALVALRGW